MSDSPEKQVKHPGLEKAGIALTYTFIGSMIVSLLLGVYALASLVF